MSGHGHRVHRRVVHKRRRPAPAGVHGRRLRIPERPRDRRVELPDPVAGYLLEEDGPECESAIRLAGPDPRACAHRVT